MGRNGGRIAALQTIQGGGLSCADACCVFFDERNHVGHALRPVGTELVLEIERGKYLRDIHIRDFARRAILNRCDDERDNPLCDRRIAVCKELQFVRFTGGIDPNL